MLSFFYVLFFFEDMDIGEEEGFFGNRLRCLIMVLIFFEGFIVISFMIYESDFEIEVDWDELLRMFVINVEVSKEFFVLEFFDLFVCWYVLDWML